MTLNELQELLASWISEDVDDENHILVTKSRIEFLSEHMFDQYEAGTAAAPSPFRHKLAAWLASESDGENRKLMFRLLGRIMFFGRHEMNALYETVYSRNIVDWIISTSQIQLLSGDAKAQLYLEVQDSLYIGITDSFNLGTFVRLNGISGISRRLTLESINPFPTVEEFKDNYLQDRTRIVLLEDFVGTGTQALDYVRFVSSLGENQPKVLFCPLIICPSGHKDAGEIAAQYPHLTYDPVLVLPKHDFVTPELDPDCPEIFAKFKQLAIDVHPKVRANGWAKDYGPFGFQQTGALVVKYDNCPDNTLPMIHHESATPWAALFQRVSRE